ncbi:DUF1648 domain-containing protein [Glutamicibacter sp. NPDC087344]|uniref:DUF1648 domain-containing protein n=1 Tax=Glutamicibacter sp. NPDC087344 TaxID=3363994 RepID=UPI00381391B7
MLDKRPPRTYKTGAVTAALRITGIVVTAGAVITLLVNYSNMPATVPTHFNFRGEADSFGPKTSVLWLALLQVLVQTLLSWVSTKPRIMNYPAPLTENNAQALYREGERLLVWVGLCVSVLFAGTTTVHFSPIGGRIVAVAGSGLILITLTGVIRLFRASNRTTETTSPDYK